MWFSNLLSILETWTQDAYNAANTFLTHVIAANELRDKEALRSIVSENAIITFNDAPVLYESKFCLHSQAITTLPFWQYVLQKLMR